jgi:hypothetical protein
MQMQQDRALGLAPVAVLEFFIRDSGVHRFSTVEQIESGALPAAHSASLAGGGGGGGAKAKGGGAPASKKSEPGGVVDLTGGVAPAAKKAKPAASASAAPVVVDLSDGEDEE